MSNNNARPRRRKPNAVSRPKVPVSRPHTPDRPVPKDHALVAGPDAEIAFDDFDSTAMFDRLRDVRALPAEEVSRAIVRRSIAEARGYTDDELFAMAEVGYHYLRSGGLRLALVVFDGLTAIRPDEPYFWLAMGLAKDYLDDKPGAHAAYVRARKLDPSDPRPDINIAELHLERRDRRRATPLLRRAAAKADRVGDVVLAQKANALLRIVGRARP